VSRRRRIPIPLLIVGLAGVAALLILNREAPPERVAGFSATTALEAPVSTLAEAWPWAERVLGETPGEFSLRTVVFDLSLDRTAPPRRILMGFRSATNDRDFTMTFRNPELELVVSQAFPTPPRMRELPSPGAVDPVTVVATLSQAMTLADSALAERTGEQVGPDVEVDVVLRSRSGRPEWRVSYARITEGEPVGLGTVVVDAVNGAVLASPDSASAGGASDGQGGLR